MGLVTIFLAAIVTVLSNLLADISYGDRGPARALITNKKRGTAMAAEIPVPASAATAASPGRSGGAARQLRKPQSNGRGRGGAFVGNKMALSALMIMACSCSSRSARPCISRYVTH